MNTSPTSFGLLGVVVAGSFLCGSSSVGSSAPQPSRWTTGDNGFDNPSRDRGRVIGEAGVESGVRALATPLELAGRNFTSGCRIAVRRLAPAREGVELAPLVPKLGAFPDSQSWSARMRRPLVPFPSADVKLLRNQLRRVAVNPDAVLDGYRALADR
jgi:hypothetical protein